MILRQPDGAGQTQPELEHLADPEPERERRTDTTTVIIVPRPTATSRPTTDRANAAPPSPGSSIRSHQTPPLIDAFAAPRTDPHEA